MLQRRNVTIDVKLTVKGNVTEKAKIVFFFNCFPDPQRYLPELYSNAPKIVTINMYKEFKILKSTFLC